MRSDSGSLRQGVESFMDMLSPVQPTTLTEQAYQLLKDAIITLELRPGTPLSELQVASRLGISKSPVREALQRLSRDGLVTIETNRRCVVTGLDVRSIRDWYELREIVEPESLRRVVSGIEPDTVEFLRDITNKAIAAVERQDPRAYIHNSDLFHVTLIELSPNQSLVAVVRDLFDKIRRVRIAQYQEDSMTEHRSVTLQGLHAHQEIIDHLAAGEHERAVDRLRADIHRFIELLDQGHLNEALARVAFR
jgi:DNA-binding GntR family transcriptional regulator